MNIGFIGTGNMGGAILKGYSKNAKADGNKILAFDVDKEKLKAIEEGYGAIPCASPQELVRESDIVFIGIKPNLYGEVLPVIKEAYHKDKLIISMAAGIKISFLEEHLGSDGRIVRIMPNLPAMVGEGMTAACRNKQVDDQDFAQALKILEAVGVAQEVTEEMIHTVIGVSGSSPAYTYMYIDALAKAAEKNGMPYEQAIIFAAQSCLGAAKMVLETKESPEQLRINVCSPGGTTIEAVNTLFENGFVENIQEGFQAAVEKSKEMSK
ncbi:MAG: pyrroline-5-carboxylate reductase [Anaerovoracaceae bacterium]